MVKTILKIFVIVLTIQSSSAQDSTNFKQYDTFKTFDILKHKEVYSFAADKLPLVKSNKDHDNLDVNLFRSINKNRSKFKDAVLPIVDRSGPPMGLVYPITSIVYGRSSKNYYDENSGYLLGIAEGLNFCLTFGTKYIVKRKRPYAGLKNVYHKEIQRTDPYSFPSGHTSIPFTIAALYNMRYPKYPQIYVPMYVYSLIVAYGRPYFGMHYPSDLLGGMVVGAGSAAIIFSLRSNLFKFKNNILNENKEDAGSINGYNAVIFGGALVVSGIIGQFVLHSSKINLSVLPYGKNSEVMNLNLKLSF